MNIMPNKTAFIAQDVRLFLILFFMSCHFHLNGNILLNKFNYKWQDKCHTYCPKGIKYAAHLQCKGKKQL